jgi:hypothetical protein
VAAGRIVTLTGFFVLGGCGVNPLDTNTVTGALRACASADAPALGRHPKWKVTVEPTRP